MSSSSEEWSNWSGSVTCRPLQWHKPASEADVVEVVRHAAVQGESIRVAGSGHSFTPLCASDEVLLSLEGLSGVETVDDQGRAWIRSGTKIHDLGDPLADRGWALANQGDVDVQAIAGAISTGTHGTGPTLGSLSTQLVGLRLVTSSGELLEISPESDLEMFRAAGVSLGSLGVITAVRLQLVPRVSPARAGLPRIAR